MPLPFRIPFFSGGSTPKISSRPPFRPAGIAEPSKQAASQETKSKAAPSLSRVRSNVAVIADSSNESQSSSRGVATPPRVEKQSNQSGSPSKKHESLGTEERKVTIKEKSLRDSQKESGKKINQVIEKPQISRSERKEEEAHEQRKKNEVEKFMVEERKSKSAEEQQKRKETEKLAMEGKKKALLKDIEENSNSAQEQQKKKEETEKLAVEEKKKALLKDVEEKSKTAQEQQRKETEKLVVEEKKKALRKDMEDNSKAAQKQQKRKETEKLASQEKNREPPVGREDATQSKTTRHISAASESTRGPKDPPERKLQNRGEIHTDDNQQKDKGESTSNHGNRRATNGESLMSRKIKEDIRDGISKLTWGTSNGDEKSVNVYTLTGENRGATMAIGSEKNKKDDEIHIRRGYRSNPDESPNTSASEERSKNLKDRDKEEAKLKAYVNGNTQTINNSIVCESSVNENDPGVHMSFRFEESKKEVINPPENVAEKKAETVRVTTTEKKGKNEPRVRRRCLRGLLAESSESENPLKPRRHGCRFTCKDKDIENT